MTPIPPGWRTTRAARATRTRSAASRRWRRAPRPRRAVTSRRSSTGRRRSPCPPGPGGARRRVEEAYLCGRTDLALEARRTLLRLHEAAGERRAAGDDLRWLSRILWWSGQGMEAAAVGDMAIATLEAFPDSRELAMALSGRSQLAMLAWERERAIELGTRAIALARRIDDQETVTHALTNVGTALLGSPEHEQGVALLEEAFTLAREIGSDDHAVRALINLGVGTLAKTRTDNGGARARARVRARARAGRLRAVRARRARQPTACCAATGTRRRPTRAPRWISASSSASACVRR